MVQTRGRTRDTVHSHQWSIAMYRGRGRLMIDESPQPSPNSCCCYWHWPLTTFCTVRAHYSPARQPQDTMEPAVPSFPVEIIRQIIDGLEDDTHALLNCALVNPAFLACSRKVLYKNIVLAGIALSKAWLLSRTLTADPTIAALVRALRISDLRLSPTFDAFVPSGENAYLTSDLLPFWCLSELRTLQLLSVDCRATSDVVLILRSLPRLERLQCEDLSDVVPSESATFTRAQGPGLTADEDTLPILKELVVKHGLWKYAELAEELAGDYPTIISNLRVLDFSFGLTAQAFRWVPIIRAAGPHLQSVSVSVTDRVSRMNLPTLGILPSFADADAYDNDHAYVLDNIAHCSSLETLCLKYHPPMYGTHDEAPPDEVARVLCDVLERKQVPWPAIRRLELWLPDREGQGPFIPRELCAVLARAILNKERYPRFNELVLRIRHQRWVERVSMWSSSMPLRQDRTEIVGRWKTALSAFEDINSITLDVDLLHANGA
ncbi:hypothetical protein FKP32DRAFT_536483 [Trametes sanguinea]|nr:hypothetical protein FKP32DRAFT_536483 [Trametes sanguinea]